ncbi:MAG: phosphate/phosphite/phosphonate ABC transporter substrate-binding protein [Candidatus Bipolaricaulota bacterium]|nr:phosphate/phosphite/phosphonate ABC transporter substrate-binding protein [Candidatus Bipolaricaulota bacterium]MCS7274959.1 phosphate/phosphite/phosphonate ABC transporter substrate-binding protein [Candidatus Bipolaricaulota bacterium]MDW8110203.1 phosphate/phosphite/phosphonate ABC transporter substrate-binding protein [Candidatus Bipolaricaulota bacterium]
MGLFRARRVVGLVVLLVAGLVLGGLPFPAASQQGTLIPEELVIGMVPSRPATILQPPVEGMAKLVLDYVQKNGFPQVRRVRAVIPESYPATIEALGAGRLHVGLLGPFQIVQVVDSYGSIPIAVTKRGERLTFRSQFMVHVDSPLKSFDDLVKHVKDGRPLKFSYGGSATSTSGFLFPCKKLKDLGILPGDYRNFKTIRAANHLASAIAVYKKDVDVGVGFEDVREDLNSDRVKQELGWRPGDPNPSTRVGVIGYSDDIPNDGIVAIKELDARLRETIKQAFVALMKTDEGKKHGKDAVDATDFVPVPEGYDMLKALQAVRVVANEIQPNLAKCENQ